MWKTALIWRLMNIPLRYSHPFYKLPSIEPPATKMSIHGCLVINILLFIGAFFIAIIFVGSPILVFIGILTGSIVASFFIVLFLITMLLWVFGGYLAILLISQLSTIQKTRMYDLIEITSYGHPQTLWLLGRRIYNKHWLKDLVIFVNATFISTILVAVLGGLWQIILMVITIYMYFMQGGTIGYLIGLWSSQIDVTRFDKIMTAITTFFGYQLGLGLINILILVYTSTRYDSMRWQNIFIFILIATIIASEVIIRLLLRSVARQSELPYAVWRSEVGI